MFALNFAYMGGFFLTPLFLEQGLNYSVGSAGLFQIARPLAFAIAAPAAGTSRSDRHEGHHPRRVAADDRSYDNHLRRDIGTGGRGHRDSLASPSWCPAWRTGPATPSVSTMVADSVDSHQLGSANDALQVVTQVGVVIGIQVMQSVQASRQAVSGVAGLPGRLSGGGCGVPGGGGGRRQDPAHLERPPGPRDGAGSGRLVEVESYQAAGSGIWISGPESRWR